MLKIVTVNWRDYEGRGAEYVNTLHDMVRRNLPAGFEGEFHCFTDDPTGLDPSIIVRDLPGNLEGWWNKLYLFKDGLFEPDDRIVYFDLDTLITGRLDEIVQYDGDFAILRDAYRPDGLQSSVMAWRPGAVGHIWHIWNTFGRPKHPGGDQQWIETCVERPDILQIKFPGLFVSYKATGGQPPQSASVVFFHGHPRPHEVTAGWVPEVWKIGGITRAQLDSVCNTGGDRLLENVRASCKCDLAWLEVERPHDGHAVIVGGGPSLASTFDELAWRQSIGQTVWALNGSAEWLNERGVTPDFHVLVDARPENARFVARPEQDTLYLVGSQCDGSLFKALDSHDIMLWHSGAPGIADLLKVEPRPVNLIGGGSTVGLQAIALAYAMGYRKIHLYGFDSSLKDDAHHAYDQPLNNGDFVVDAIAGDRKFRSTAWMVQQTEEFCRLATELANDGVTITVHGDGLLPHVARCMAAGMPVTAPDIRAAEILNRLDLSRPVIGAEIGVFAGDLSSRLLQCEAATLYMVDSWAGAGADYEGDSGDWHAGLSQEKQDAYCERAETVTAFAEDRARILRMSSREAASLVPDGSLDFVFIDADHSYEGCSADIAAWLPKLKPGALLSGHDYANHDFPEFGVTRAVDEFVSRAGLRLEIGDNFTWFVRLNEAASEAA